MAQLRDASTSALLFEGTPTDVVVMAEALGRKDVLFDDVGAKFDPDAVLRAARETADGLAAAVADPKEKTTDSLEQAADEAKGALTASTTDVKAARKTLREARASTYDEPAPDGPPPVQEIHPEEEADAEPPDGPLMVEQG